MITSREIKYLVRFLIQYPKNVSPLKAIDNYRDSGGGEQKDCSEKIENDYFVD